MTPNEATREVFWNITHVWLMYVLFAASLAIAVFGIYRRVARWRRGLAETNTNRFDRPRERIGLVLRHALAQGRTVRDAHAGFIHTLIYAGFIILAAATTVVFLDYDLSIRLMRGSFYLYFQSLIVDIFGALFIAGLIFAALRRLILRPSKLVLDLESLWLLNLLLFIGVSGFLIEGLRIAATNDPFGAWSPFGYLIARGAAGVMSIEAMRSLHLGMWWGHAVAVFGLIAWAPFTKLSHIIFAPLNIYTASLEPIGATLKPVDFDLAERLGVNLLVDFSWKDLADLDACTECGRCTASCPAASVGKELSPRDIILQLQRLPFDKPIAGNVPAASPQALWECTTCAACVEACPVFIEQMPKIVDLRRYQVMEETKFPDTMQQAITSMELRGHPFRGTTATRLDWTRGLDIDLLSEMPNPADVEVLLWVGCGGALIERNQKVVRATAQLLRQAGVRFAVLGREEKCTGDPARRIGNEFLFEVLAKENTDRLKRYKIKTIVTSCPHCFNTLRNEYPHFGGKFEVYHHSQYLAKLVDEGKLKAREGADGIGSNGIVTWHDPCYLGRHNGTYDEPRRLVQLSMGSGSIQDSSSASTFREPEANRSESFCCGGGGGMSFIEEPRDKRVNQERARQLLETGATTVAVGCPFCLTMLEDGINARRGDREVEVLDVAEMLWRAVEKEKGSV